MYYIFSKNQLLILALTSPWQAKFFPFFSQCLTILHYIVKEILQCYTSFRFRQKTEPLLTLNDWIASKLYWHWSILVQLYFAPTSFVTSSSCSGFERRPLKHPSCPDGTERDSGPPKPPRTGTVPALVPKPPSYPLVKVVGKFYTLKCRYMKLVSWDIAFQDPGKTVQGS